MPQDSDKATHYYNLGIQYEKENNIEKAQREFERALREDPDFPYPHKALGEILYRAGELERARTHLETAVRLDPDWVAVIELLARIHHQLGDYDRAVELQRRALRKDPGNIEYRTTLGRMMVSAERYVEAITTLEDALEDEADNFLVHYHLGVAYGKRAMQDMESSIAHWRRACELNPNDAPAFRNLGIALFSKGLLPDALRAFRNAQRLDPDDAVSQRFIRYSESVENFG